jgi:hypothetical protein
MEKSTVLNGNKLIAEFLESWYDTGLEPAYFVKNNEAYGLEDLIFHESWDWLMSVVEKIESIHDDFHGYFGCHIISNGCTISGTKLKPGVVNAYFDQIYSDTKIQSVWQAVVGFIKWYNKEKNR